MTSLQRKEQTRDFSVVEAPQEPTSSSSKPKSAYVKLKSINIDDVLEKIEVIGKSGKTTETYKVQIEFNPIISDSETARPKVRPVFVTTDVNGKKDTTQKQIMMPSSYIRVVKMPGFDKKGHDKKAILTWVGQTNVDKLQKFYNRLAEEFADYVISRKAESLYSKKPVTVDNEVVTVSDVITKYTETVAELEDPNVDYVEVKKKANQLKLILIEKIASFFNSGLIINKKRDDAYDKWIVICTYPIQQKADVDDETFARRQKNGNISKKFFLHSVFQRYYEGQITQSMTVKQLSIASSVSSLKKADALKITSDKGSYYMFDHDMIGGLKDNIQEYIYVVAFNLVIDDIYLMKDNTGYRLNEKIETTSLIAIEPLPKFMVYENNDKRGDSYYDTVNDDEDDNDGGYTIGEEPRINN